MLENTYHIIIIVLLVIVIFILLGQCDQNNRVEYYTANTINTEALQDIASVYNDKDLSINNLNVSKQFNLMPKFTIVAYAGSSAPYGWAQCNGQQVTAMDGSRFTTPDLRGRFIVGVGNGSGLTNRAINAKGGAESVTLNTSQIPSHTHGIINAYAWPTNNRDPCNYIVGKECQSGIGRSAFATYATGGGKSHENMPPFYALAYIIKL